MNLMTNTIDTHETAKTDMVCHRYKNSATISVPGKHVTYIPQVDLHPCYTLVVLIIDSFESLIKHIFLSLDPALLALR